MELNQRALAARQFIMNQVKSVSNYFKPAENVRVRDFVREVPGAVAQTFSGTRDTVVKGGKILGEGLAYATSPNVRKMYQAGNTNILPTVSNTTPRQMLANTAKSAFEIAPVGKIKGLATAAMSAKLLPRVLAGGAMGYGYDVTDKMSRPEPVSQSTFHPGIATLAGALFGGMSRPTSEMFGQAGREIGDDIRNINPANRLSHKVVDKYDTEPVPGVFAMGGIQQQRPIMESFRKEVETTQMPYSPQSSIARFLMGKQKVGMGIEPQSPLLQEAGKYKSAEEFVKAQRKMYRGTALPQKGDLDVADSYGMAYGKGAYLASDESFARQYGENISELYPRLDKPFPMDKEVSPEFVSKFKKDFPEYSEKYGTTGEDIHAFIGNQDDANEYLQKLGYDGLIDAASEGSKQTIVFDPKKILTKSQLTDLYNKAQGGKGMVLLHGGPKELKGGKLNTGMGIRGDAGGIFFSPDTPTGRLYANSYTLKGSIKTGDGKIHKVQLSPDAKIFDAANPADLKKIEPFISKQGVEDITFTARNGTMDWATGGQYFEDIQKAGFDGAKLSERPKGFDLFNEKGQMVKTKEDAISYNIFNNKKFEMLPDKPLYNKAHKK